jgi:hypothetical protein
LTPEAPAKQKPRIMRAPTASPATVPMAMPTMPMSKAKGLARNGRSTPLRAKLTAMLTTLRAIMAQSGRTESPAPRRQAMPPKRTPATGVALAMMSM